VSGVVGIYLTVESGCLFSSGFSLPPNFSLFFEISWMLTLDFPFLISFHSAAKTSKELGGLVSAL